MSILPIRSSPSPLSPFAFCPTDDPAFLLYSITDTRESLCRTEVGKYGFFSSSFDFMVGPDECNSGTIPILAVNYQNS